ncbi:helix-turn-helix domain-containing protein [Rhodococcoides corynebacterioides]|uniref:helix-turn-helix domain-containing protein n=1 Tax=Rhodococcoides corynebacterioides TaxID=53972 RepID=UPI0008345AE1|nr:helix-turn-helix domain-containing protein [Rhodococcus corynebacterioides]
MTTETKSPLATAAEAATYLRSTTQKLAEHRYRGTGPRFVKHGRTVLYRWADLEAYLEAHTFQRTDDRPVSA